MDIVMQYTNKISESDQNILDNINNLTLDEIEDILRYNINKNKVLILAHIFSKLLYNTDKYIGFYLNEFDHQQRKNQLGVYCSILYSRYVKNKIISCASE
jgi:hypothetical protein